jgi:hypothetical protein
LTSVTYSGCAAHHVNGCAEQPASRRRVDFGCCFSPLNPRYARFPCPSITFDLSGRRE